MLARLLLVRPMLTDNGRGGARPPEPVHSYGHMAVEEAPKSAVDAANGRL